MPRKTQKSAQKSALRRAAGIDKSNKHITKISASSTRPVEKTTEKPAEKPVENQTKKPATKPAETPEHVHKFSLKSKAEQKAEQKSAAIAQKAQAKSDKKSLDSQEEKPLSEIFLLARPFVALGRYFRDSWRELRQVRWPGRKSAWKLTFAVLVYCAVLMIFILILDLIFTLIFETILK